MLQPPAAEPAYVLPDRPGTPAIVLYARTAPDGGQILRLQDRTPSRPWTLVAVVGADGTVTTLRTEGLPGGGEVELVRRPDGFLARAPGIPDGKPRASFSFDPGAFWLPVHLFFTSLWETRGDFASMTVGESRSGQGLFTTSPLRAAPFTLQRLPDPAAPLAGTRTLRRYRLVAEGMRVELVTDGRRLVALRSADGLQAVRVGAEGWAAALPPPAEGAP